MFLLLFITVLCYPESVFAVTWEIGKPPHCENGDSGKCKDSKGNSTTGPVNASHGSCITVHSPGIIKQHFHYCGGYSSGAYDCDGWNYLKTDKDEPHWYSSGNLASLYDEKYKETRYFACCNGNDGTKGTWKEITKYRKEHPTWGFMRAEDNRKKPKNVTGGICYQEVYTNVCGAEVLAKDCNTATTCDEKYAERITSDGSKRCVLPCDAGMAFKPNSDECIECPITATSGIVDNECVVCDASKVYDVVTEECISLTDNYIAIANYAYTKCWLCPEPATLKECLLNFSKNPSTATVPNICKLRPSSSNSGNSGNSGNGNTGGQTFVPVISPSVTPSVNFDVQRQYVGISNTEDATYQSGREPQVLPPLY